MLTRERRAREAAEQVLAQERLKNAEEFRRIADDRRMIAESRLAMAESRRIVAESRRVVAEEALRKSEEDRSLLLAEIERLTRQLDNRRSE